MKEIYQHWKDCFFTETLLVVVLVTTLIISIKKRKRHNLLRYFPLYTVCLLSVFISVYVVIYSDKIYSYSVTTFNFINYIDYLFILVELSILIHFFLSILKNRNIRKILIFIALVFIPYYLIELFSDKYFPRSISETTQSRVYTVESLILLSPCFVYFYELFKKPPTLNLKNEPAFWIVSGWSFFATCTLPYSLLENYLRKSHSNLMTELYSVFYIFYILLFIMIIKAYSCKKESI